MRISKLYIPLIEKISRSSGTTIILYDDDTDKKTDSPLPSTNTLSRTPFHREVQGPCFTSSAFRTYTCLRYGSVFYIGWNVGVERSHAKDRCDSGDQR
jgi:hypothetical protein